MLDHGENFFQKKTIGVTIESDSETIYGELEYGECSIPKLRLNTQLNIGDFYEKLLIKNELICTTLSDQRVFILHGIKLNGGEIFADYLTEGKILLNFDTLEIYLTGLSVWIEGRRGFNYKREKLEREITNNTFSENFNFKSNRYLLTTDFRINSRNETPVNFNFELEHTVIVEKINGDLGFDECKELTLEIRNLFSLLTAQALSVYDVNIFKKSNNNHYQRLYFPSVLYKKNPLQYDFNAICSFRFLTKNNKWSAILSNYFNSHCFRDIWNRLIPSYSAQGIWEYSILSRVIILEMYANWKTVDKKMKLDKAIYSAFIVKIKETIDEFYKSNEMSEENSAVYIGMTKSILETKNTSLPTFKEKYNTLMSEISYKLKEAISFTDNDFIKIKKIRDSVAHGLEYDTYSHEGDITYEIQLSNRLLVLLVCLCHLELGLQEEEIALSLNTSHCTYIRNANLNQRELDKLSGQAFFIKLSTPPKLLVLKNHDQVIINYSKEKNSWILNEDLTENIRIKWYESKIPELIDYIKSILGNGSYHNCESVGKAYIESNGIETEHLGLVIIHH